MHLVPDALITQTLLLTNIHKNIQRACVYGCFWIYLRGDYKKLNNHVEAYTPDGKSLGTIFQTATPLETPNLMKELCEWMQKELESSEQHPLIIVSIFILEFLAIHPFQDGNGRLSRAMTTLLLLRLGYEYVPYSSMERIIEENKDKYYLALRNAQTEEPGKSEELGLWVTFFLTCMNNQKNVLFSKLKKEKFLMSLPKLSEQIIVVLKEHGKLSLSEIVKLTGANRNTVKSHVFRLVGENQIQKEGKGKGTIYFK